MNTLLEWLAGGTLQSDGLANQVVDFVMENPETLEDLLQGLSVEDNVIRGRAADALEKIARIWPERISEHLPLLIQKAIEDPVAMVRWHLAMLLGYLIDDGEVLPTIHSTLLLLLEDRSVFVMSWAMVGLCLLGRRYPEQGESILCEILTLKDHSSAAIRTKVRMIQELLTDPQKPFPEGWVKARSQKSQPIFGLMG